MIDQSADTALSAPPTRYAPLALFFGFTFALYTALRFYLDWHFGPFGPMNPKSLAAFAIGARADLAAITILMLPLCAWLTFLPEKFFSSQWHRRGLWLAFLSYAGVQVFLFKVEIEFFDEFNARFNTVAVDYLIYPREVFVNIWQSYPVPKILAVTIGSAVFLAFVFRRRLLRAGERVLTFQRRLAVFGVYVLIGLIANATFSYSSTRFSTDRVMNEISSDGAYSFAYAAWSRHLDYAAYYDVVPKDDAYARVRSLVAPAGTTFVGGPDTIERITAGRAGQQPVNVVVILVESFGSEFWGVLNDSSTAKASVTPRMDALSHEGLLFTHLYASGNRTVRGMEGVLSSFPPLPGDSIVKRSQSDHVSTLARVLKNAGYSTLFLSGGRGVFDGMRSFTTRNGYDRFIEQKDFPKPTFTTIWGVCDEDLARRSVGELRALSKLDRPFFATMLTVSNHKPYTYPKGRIPENPEQHSRQHAVKYTDWALGEFFALAKKEDFYKNTVFAVVADHGARVYGSQSIPIASYKIPLLIVGAGVPVNAKNDTLGGSLDVGPTVLGYAGVSYPSTFFGRDLSTVRKNDGWAVLNHNRDIGFRRGDRLVVLGLNKTIDHFRIEGDRQIPIPSPSTALDDTDKDAMAIYQVADDLYTHERYRVSSAPEVSNSDGAASAHPKP